jgi:hypothetical protein
VLYQIVFHSHDKLQNVWESRFQHHYGCLRDEVSKPLTEYLNCGILAHGFGRELSRAAQMLSQDRTGFGVWFVSPA